MAAYSFHGLRVVSGGTLTPDPVEALLGTFRQSPHPGPLPREAGERESPSSSGEGGGNDLTISLNPSDVLPPPASGPALFRHGALAVRRDGDHLAVDSPAAALRVRGDGCRIEGAVRPGTLASGPDALDGFAAMDLLIAFALALQPLGRYHVHAACTVSPAGEAVLVAGTGGAGKSTLALALVASGHAYLGDDVVFLERGAAGPRLLALPRPFHVSLDSARAHPAALDHLDPARRTSVGKRVLDARAAFPGANRAEAPAPAVLLFPEVAPVPRTSLERLAPAEALGALLASALFAFTPLGSAAQRDTLAAVAGAARAFRVRLGRDLLDDPVETARGVRIGAGA